MSAKLSSGPRLLLRVCLYGVVMLALAAGASFVVGTVVLKPVVEAPTRPSTAWIAWHLGTLLDQPDVLKRELSDLRARARIEMSLFDARGRLLASNARPAPSPLGPVEVERLAREPTRFAEGSGVVARFDAEKKNVIGYTLVKYPMPDLPLGIATAQLLVALGVIAVLSIPLARSVTRPVERLATLTRAFGAGDLTARARTDRRDEIGDLARAFDEMADRIMELRRTEKELLANVSHELRTPLARIRLALELLGGGDTKRASSYVADIEEDLAELERLLDDVMTTARLDLARGTGGDVLPPLRRETLDGAQLVEAARSRFAIRFPERTLRCSVQTELPLVSADPALLRRVLDNLLDNAAKYSEKDDLIELECQGDEAGGLVMSVRDHGLGILPADLERVFEPFFRSDRSRDRATGGVGLGLAVAKRIVEAHGGTILAESSRNSGTAIRVTIPARG